MASDRLTLIADMKFDKEPFSPFQKASERMKKQVEKLEGNTKKLQRSAVESNKRLNKMLDDYRNRGNKATSTSSLLLRKLTLIAGAYISVGKAMESVKLASTMEETQNKLNVVFGDLSRDASDWAENYADSLGFSELKTKEALGDIQNLFTGFGIGRKESSALAKQIVTLGNDLDSFNNLSARGVDVQKTLQSALMGQTESAKTLGASILETQLNVASQAMGLGEYNNKWDEATKIQVRLHAIMMQSKDAIGDVERTLDTETATRRRANAEDEKTLILVGQKLLPLQMRYLQIRIRLNKTLQENIGIIDKLTGAIETSINVGSSFLKLLTGTTVQSRILQGVVGTLTAAYVTYKTVAALAFSIDKAHTIFTATKTIPTIFMKNAGLVGTAIAVNALTAAEKIGIVVTKTWTGAQWLLNAAMTANPIGLAVAGVAALTAGFVVAYKKIEPFRNLIDKLWGSIKKFGGKALEIVFGRSAEGTQNTQSVNSPGTTKSVVNNTSNVRNGNRNLNVGGDTVNINVNGSNMDSNELKGVIQDTIREEKRKSVQRQLAVL